MSVNRVDYGGSTLIDLTSDTITADKLYKGYTAHAADGSAITGALATAPLEPLGNMKTLQEPMPICMR